MRCMPLLETQRCCCSKALSDVRSLDELTALIQTHICSIERLFLGHREVTGPSERQRLAVIETTAVTPIVRQTSLSLGRAVLSSTP